MNVELPADWPPSEERLQKLAENAEVACEVLDEMLNSEEPPVLLDVREDFEWQQGHLESAVHVPLGTVPINLKKISGAADGRTLVVYCAHGMRSLDATIFLKAMGIAPTYSLAGGLAQWGAEARPIIID